MLSSHPRIFTYCDQALNSGVQRPQQTDHGPRLRDQGALLGDPGKSLPLCKSQPCGRTQTAGLGGQVAKVRQPRSPPHKPPPRAACGQLQKAWEGPVCSLLSNEKEQKQVYEQKAEVQGPWSQKTWVQIPTLPLTSYVTWGYLPWEKGKTEPG